MQLRRVLTVISASVLLAFARGATCARAGQAEGLGAVLQAVDEFTNATPSGWGTSGTVSLPLGKDWVDGPSIKGYRIQTRESSGWIELRIAQPRGSTMKIAEWRALGHWREKAASEADLDTSHAWWDRAPTLTTVCLLSRPTSKSIRGFYQFRVAIVPADSKIKGQTETDREVIEDADLESRRVNAIQRVEAIHAQALKELEDAEASTGGPDALQRTQVLQLALKIMRNNRAILDIILDAHPSADAQTLDSVFESIQSVSESCGIESTPPKRRSSTQGPSIEWNKDVVQEAEGGWYALSPVGVDWPDSPDPDAISNSSSARSTTWRPLIPGVEIRLIRWEQGPPKYRLTTTIRKICVQIRPVRGSEAIPDGVSLALVGFSNKHKRVTPVWNRASVYGNWLLIDRESGTKFWRAAEGASHYVSNWADFLSWWSLNELAYAGDTLEWYEPGDGFALKVFPGTADRITKEQLVTDATAALIKE